MTQPASGQCPICNNPASIVQIVDERHYDCNKVTCPRCGYYALSNPDDIRDELRRLDAIEIKTYATNPTPPGIHATYTFMQAVSKTAYASKVKTDSSEARAVISHAISKGEGLGVRILNDDDLTNILTHTALPTLAGKQTIFLGLSGIN
jgi:hypothetical protein